MRHRHSSIAVLALVLLLSSVFAVILSGMSSKAAARQQATVTALAEMLRIWKAHGLSIPPPDAPLARFPTPTSFDDSGTPGFSIGFLLQEATSQKPGTILSGYSNIAVESGDDALIPDLHIISRPDEPDIASFEATMPKAFEHGELIRSSFPRPFP